MMNIQYQKIVDDVFRLIDRELEIDTIEGNEVFIQMTNALFSVYMKYRPKRDQIHIAHEAKRPEWLCDHD